VAFQPGDVVQLRSGGPAMTVQEIRADGDVLCVWFDGKQKNRALFQHILLAPYSSSVPVHAEAPVPIVTSKPPRGW